MTSDSRFSFVWHEQFKVVILLMKCVASSSSGHYVKSGLESELMPNRSIRFIRIGVPFCPKCPSSDGGECYNQTESLMWEQRRRQIINFTKLSLHLMISIFTIFVCSINTLNHLVCVIHCKFFQAQHWFLTISYDKNLLSLDCVVLISNHILW